MAWEVTLGGKAVSFDDLPPALFQAVALRNGESWVTLYYTPGKSLDALVDLLGEIAKHLDVAPPPVPKTMREARALLACIREVESDLPVEYEDGFPPKADDQTTPSSSGSSADSDGPPTL